MPGEFPAPAAFDRPGLRGAVAAFHGYSRVLGALRRAFAPREKHWWHLSLALTARGLTTTPIHLPGLTIEARLDFLDGHAALLGSDGRAERWYLSGMPGRRLAEFVGSSLSAWGATLELDPDDFGRDTLEPGAQRAGQEIFGVLSWAHALLQAFKARERGETSPVQLWPHHFDLALLWLTGRRLAGVDPADEETADEQMNFGFTFGAGDERPYFYVTRYPGTADFPGVELPAFDSQHAAGWTGVRVDYDALREASDPFGRLLALFERLRTRDAGVPGPADALL